MLDRGRRYVGRRVLDLGSGVGTFTELLGQDTEVVAVDPDGAFVELLREKFAKGSNVTVIEGDAFSAEIAGSFDTVLCFNVLEHIADDAATLSRLHDLLDRGGHLLLIVPAHRALYGRIDEQVGHERRYTRSDVDERLRAAGFETLELRYVNPLGALGWIVSSRFLRRPQVPHASLRVFDALVPVLRKLDRLPLPFGLSVWAAARKIP